MDKIKKPISATTEKIKNKTKFILHESYQGSKNLPEIIKDFIVSEWRNTDMR